MLKRSHYLWPYVGEAPAETLQLEQFGYARLAGVFHGAELAALRAEVAAVFREWPPDERGDPVRTDKAEYRYQMFQRSPWCQRAMAHPRILAVVEPLLGNDCHVINSTAWQNPPGLHSQPEACYWHTDAGPHIPRGEHVPWPDAIPYPIFVIGTHIYLEDCGADEGPTAVVATSHRSGRPVPPERRFDVRLSYAGHEMVALPCRAGDVAFFVSDAWHRRLMPTERSRGRFFLQTNYGRRDIAPRVLSPEHAHHANADAIARAGTERERTLIGLHRPSFYDG